MAKNLTQTVLEFLRNRPEESFTVPTVIDEMEKAFWKGDIAENVIPPKMRQGFKNAKNNNQKIPADDYNRFRRGIYIALNIAARRQEIEKDQEEGMLRYYFTKKTQDEKIEEFDKDLKSKKYSEENLYDTLADYLQSCSIGSRRINESSSSNVRGLGGNHWLYPDLIGIQYVVKEDWKNNKLIDFMGNAEKIKLWSFEVKKDVNLSNVRELYFQAVANSSWANFGYLVVAEIKSVKASEELNMLANRHGIGVILLDREKPEGGSIKIPAKEKENVDWEMLNRLTVNGDIRECLTNIYKFFRVGDFQKKFWHLEDQ